jgi:hypothetical protein
MPTRYRSAWQRRLLEGRLARIAVPLAIPVALAVVVGVLIAVTGGGGVTQINQSALANCASPSAAAAAGAAAAASAPASAAPCPSGSAAGTGATAAAGTGATAAAGTGATAAASAGATASPAASGAAAAVPPANSFANGPIAAQQMGDVATNPVDGAGKAINLNQTPAQAAASMNCTLAVPANPLTAQGLATPWQLGDGCSMANNGTEGAFVEATILAPNGSLSVYNPLVVTAGTQPAAAPVAPTIAAGSVVEISVGFNGTNLALTGAGAQQGNCVDALGQSLIGQVSVCNSVNFYQTANADIANGTLKVPPAGTATDGQPCETTRNFALIDQDQSDNVVTKYLINGNGQTAQATPANAQAMGGATTITNGSDDALLAAFVDPANGCTPFTAPDTTNPNGTSGAQALNELSAQVNQQGTIAVVPPNDEMTLVGGQMSIAKTNVYRSLVDQPQLAGNTNPAMVAASYCQNMVNIAPARNNLDMAKDANFGTPVAAVGTNLATFLGNRLSMSFVNLGCANFGLKNPVNVTLNGNGVATAVTYNLTQQTATGAAAAGMAMNPTAGQTTGTQAQGQRQGFMQNPSGM